MAVVDFEEYHRLEREAAEWFKRSWPTDTATNADFRSFMEMMTGRPFDKQNIQYCIKRYGMTPTGKIVKIKGKVYRTFKVR